MAFSERTVLAGTMAVALWLAAQPAGAQDERLPMRIVVYDYAQVPADVLAQARTVVSRVFGEIGVDAAWMDVAGFTREMPSENAARQAFVHSVVQVNVISPDMHKMLGRKNSVLGGAGAGTSRVWIAFARIQQSARLAQADVSDVLGSVIAHEIGHVLMPPRRACPHRSHAARRGRESDRAQSTVVSCRGGEADSPNAGGPCGALTWLPCAWCGRPPGLVTAFAGNRKH